MAVVVGYTDTDEGRAALSRAAAEALLRGEPLAVLEVATGTDGPGAAESAVRDLPAAPDHVRVDRRDAHQDVAGALLDYAVEQSASLLVVGTKRRSPVGKFLLGSTAQRVLLDAEVPVLLVKPAYR